ncbi:hypothetical protein EDB83DRAFT_2411042 [Lactarius deliciosus]|nr:hypothetical protein EDB83DRAFT_2411042 [Lactarius deliciosus]
MLLTFHLIFNRICKLLEPVWSPLCSFYLWVTKTLSPSSVYSIHVLVIVALSFSFSFSFSQVLYIAFNTHTVASFRGLSLPHYLARSSATSSLLSEWFIHS